MHVSIIIPTYNRVQMLVDAVDSLCRQDYPANLFEIIIVDNNSKDNTIEFVDKLIVQHPEHNIRYVLESRQGDFYARNTGAKVANGKYLVFTDDDALFDSNYLSTIVGIFEQHPTVGVVGTRITIKWEGGTPAKWVKPYQYLLGEDSHNACGYQIWSEGMYVNNGSLAIKRDLYISVGGNNPGQIGDFLVGDAEYGLYRKIQALHIPVAFTDDVTMWHRQIVGKNDSFTDIKRRIENVGISEAYTAVFDAKDIRPRSIKKLWLRLIKCAISLRKTRAFDAYLTICKTKKFNEYIDRYRYDEQLLQLIAQHKDYNWQE